MTVLNQDDFFTQVFEQGLSNPQSKLYLPGMILSSSNPSLNPYALDKLDLGQQALSPGIQMGVSLTDLKVLGLANIAVNPAHGGSFVLHGLVTDFCAQFGQLNPPPVGVNAQFEMDTNFTLDDGDGDTTSGNMKVKMDKVSLTGQFTIGGTDLGDIEMQLANLSVLLPDDVKISAEVHFDSGAPGFNKMMENFLEQVATMRGILAGVNQQLTASLPQISADLSKIVRADLQQQLGM